MRRALVIRLGLIALHPSVGHASQNEIVAKLTEPGSWFCTSTKDNGSFLRRQFRGDGTVTVEYYSFLRLWAKASPINAKPTAQGSWKFLDESTLETIVGLDHFDTVFKLRQDQDSIFLNDVAIPMGFAFKDFAQP